MHAWVCVCGVCSVCGAAHEGRWSTGHGVCVCAWVCVHGCVGVCMGVGVVSAADAIQVAVVGSKVVALPRASLRKHHPTKFQFTLHSDGNYELLTEILQDK